jgi:predicted transport protein
MPLFQKQGQVLSLIKLQSFENEKELQILVENNLKEIFDCQFIASEFSTGHIHGGRIDTLALSEENNPVIIEYKITESSQLINQSLYYLSWLNDHKGDFEIAVKSSISKNIQIDWSQIRVICIAPDYKKYDLHAVEMMGANIELWKFKYYENRSLLFENVYNKSIYITNQTSDTTKNAVMVEAGKKAALTRATYTYDIERHQSKINEDKKFLLINLQDYISSLSEAVKEVPKKHYIAYKITKNFACIEVFKNRIALYLNINPKQLENLPNNSRDVSKIGHRGTGDFEFIIRDEKDIENAKTFIELAFNNIGGN